MLLWLVMLSMEPALFRESSSRAKATNASRDLGCVPWYIHHPHPPYQTGALASAGVAIYEGVACAMLQFFTLAANVKILKFWFFVIRVYYEKLGDMLKPLVPKFRQDLSVPLGVHQQISPKTGHRESETNSSGRRKSLEDLQMSVNTIWLVLLQSGMQSCESFWRLRLHLRLRISSMFIHCSLKFDPWRRIPVH